MIKRFIMLGAPGVGKGTQAKKLADDFEWKHISTGDMLREAMQEDNPVGRKVKDYVEKGDLVPDDLMIQLVMNRLEEDDCRHGFLLDGFPRTVPQAKKLDVFLHDSGHDLNGVISIEIPNEEIVKRLSQRLICRDCGHMMTGNDNSAKMMVCPLCKGKVTRRKDDEPDTIHHRLKVYEERTQSLIEYYMSKNLYIRIDGMGSVDGVYRKIIHALGISKK